MSGLMYDLSIKVRLSPHLVDIGLLELMPLYLGTKIQGPPYNRFMGKRRVELCR